MLDVSNECLLTCDTMECLLTMCSPSLSPLLGDDDLVTNDCWDADTDRGDEKKLRDIAHTITDTVTFDLKRYFGKNIE